MALVANNSAVWSIPKVSLIVNFREHRQGTINRYDSLDDRGKLLLGGRHKNENSMHSLL